MALVLISAAVTPGFVNVPFPAMRIMEAETRLAQLNATAAILAVRTAELQAKLKAVPPSAPPPATSCLDLLNAGKTSSGNYDILINGEKTPVYCEQENQGGGWTLAAVIAGGSNKHKDVDQVGVMPLSWPANGAPSAASKLSDAAITALATDRYWFMCGGCEAYLEPIQFDSTSSKYCGAAHKCSSKNHDNKLGADFQDSTGGNCQLPNTNSEDLGLSTWPNKCSCDSQFMAGPLNNGCYQAGTGKHGYLYVR